MPKARIDEGAALSAIRHVLNDFTSTQHQLAEQLSIRSFDWDAAAYLAGVHRTKLYHWFSDTFKRYFYETITPADMKLIKNYVYYQLNLGGQVLVYDVEQILDQRYERRQVTIAVSNCKAGYRKLQRLQTPETKKLALEDSVSGEYNPFIFSICLD